MELIGRREEVKLLDKAIKDEESHFIAIYGRKRIGKTFLVRQAFGNRFTFQHAGLSDGKLKEQLHSFSLSLRESGWNPETEPENWLDAFSLLRKLIEQSSEKKKIIFIDELSWMDTPKSGLVTALESFWNGWASGRDDIVLIICASATSWMLSNIVHNKGGLYNRLTERIHLRPFTLAECEEYIRSRKISLNRDSILRYYMVFGGVPYYWSFIEKGLSNAQNVDRMFFSKNAPLRDEFKYLYSAIFKRPEAYLKIIAALAKKKIGMTRDEIIDATKMANSGNLTEKLEELESCGFIRKYNSYGKLKKHAIYQLIDNFTLFHFQFLSDGPTDENFWTNQINQPKINTWQGLAFERVCMDHINQIKNKLGISGVLTEERSFYCKRDIEKGIFGSQIDLLIVRRDQVINLCEMKYSESEYSVTEKFDKDIKRKISDLQTVSGTKYAIFPTLVTTYGVTDNPYAYNIHSLITIDDLFQE